MVCVRDWASKCRKALVQVNVWVTRGGGLSSSSASKGWHASNALAEHVCEWVCFWPESLDFIASDWLSWKITSPSRFLLTELGLYANTTHCDCMSQSLQVNETSEKLNLHLHFGSTVSRWCQCLKSLSLHWGLCEDVGCTPLGLGNTDLIQLAFEEICGLLWVCTSFCVQSWLHNWLKLTMCNQKGMIID